MLDRKASPTSKAFNESRPRRLRRPRHLMSLALPGHLAVRGSASRYMDRRKATRQATELTTV